MSTDDRRAVVLAVLVVAGMLTAGAAVAPVGATAPTVDTGTTIDSTDQSTNQTEVSSGTNITGFTANESNSTVLQYNADSNNTKVTLDGGGTQVYSNTSADLVNWSTADANGNFNVSIQHSALADMERGIDDNVTVTATITNNTSVDSPDTTTFDFYVETDDSKSVVNVDDSDVDDGDIVSVSEDESPLGFEIRGLYADKSTVETEERNVSGDSTEVIIAFSNSTVSDDFDAAVSDASDEDKLSSFFSGTRTVALMSDGDDNTMAVPVYYESVPDDVDDDQTYAVYKDDIGGETGLVFNLGETFEDSDEVSVTTIGNAGFTTYITKYATSGLGLNSLLGMVQIPLPMDGGDALAPLVAGIPLVAGRQRAV